ncbi:alpha-amylase family glycosyl hydrolase [soil metagenome]
MQKLSHFLLSVLTGSVLLLGSCTSQVREQEAIDTAGATTAEKPVSLWPKGVTYEIFVRAFADSDGDGIGDIAGMTAKLDYLQDLGVEAVWLMPIMPSPTYHKYDVTDYYGIDPEYGTMEDFKNFLAEAHKRNIKVVIDYVINHSAQEHPWFQQAAKDKNSPYRGFYVWATDQEVQRRGATREATADSQERNPWHKVPGSPERYYGYFWAGMPDLNYDNPKVKEEMFKIGRYWLTEVGVDGFRLDAAKHIFPDGEEEKNHAFWVDFRREMAAAKPDVYLVGEVWDKAEVVAPYLKGLPALFNFDLGYAITRAVQAERDTALAANHKRIRDYYNGITSDFIDATFLTNHDQNRIMSELNGNEGRARMAASLLLTLPGAPYLYYGEEIGMLGKKPDPQIREPFLWGHTGEQEMNTAWTEAQHTTPQTVVPANEQLQDPNSLLHHYKNLIAARRSSEVLTLGELALTRIRNPQVTSFYRVHKGEALLVLHNLSGTNQEVELKEQEAGFSKVHFSTADQAAVRQGRITLPGYSSVILNILKK